MTEYWVENYSKKFTSSQNIFAKALGNTAGGVGHDLRYTLPFPRYIKRAKGSKIWDVRSISSFIKLQNFLALAISKKGDLITLEINNNIFTLWLRIKLF